jgi:hypothetical protein
MRRALFMATHRPAAGPQTLAGGHAWVRRGGVATASPLCRELGSRLKG